MMTANQSRTTVSVPGYDITIAAGQLDTLAAIVREVASAHRYALITDEHVGPLYAARVARQFSPDELHVITTPAGEIHKNRDSWASVTDQLLTNGFGRDSTIIALGGGVIGDLAGFVAATFMRGIPFVQVPTTLLAMIDASIGGKTGVDTPAGKNLVGAFHPPRAVVVDPQLLDTLELIQIRSGLAEAFKHGAIADAAYFSFLGDASRRLLAAPAERDPDATFRLIAQSVHIKADVVSRDVHELGVRKVLNFGHTIGHAIELLSDFTMSHGDAVARGMVLEAAAGERAGITASGTATQLAHALRQVGLPTDYPADYSPDRVLELMRGDKKSRAGAIEYAIPTRIGVMAGAERGYGVRLDDAVVRSVLVPTSNVQASMNASTKTDLNTETNTEVAR